MNTISKNNRSYDGGDVRISMLGIFDIFADKIDYSVKQEHQRNYGLSREPRSWSKGKKEYECKLTLMMEDVVAIQKALGIAGGKSLIDLDPFTIIVSFNSPENVDLPTVIDKIYCKFQNTGRSVGNEQGLKYEYEMFVLSIKENVSI